MQSLKTEDKRLIKDYNECWRRIDEVNTKRFYKKAPLKVIKQDKFYPKADYWLWNYCIFLGKYTDPISNKNYDLGIHITYEYKNRNSNLGRGTRGWEILRPSMVKTEFICTAITRSERIGQCIYKELYNKDYYTDYELSHLHEEVIKRAVEQKYISRCSKSFEEPNGFKSNPERIKNYFIN